MADPARKLPDPQEVADAIKLLVDLPPGQRSLRTVAGPVFTEGVAEYNTEYERTRDHLAAVLQRADQAITWTPAQAAGQRLGRKRKAMSAAARKAVSARMKKYWAARRAAKAGAKRAKTAKK